MGSVWDKKNEIHMDKKLVSEELAESSLKGCDEEAKFKGFFPKPIPIVKPILKSIPVVKTIPKLILIVKPISKSISIVKPIPNEEEKFQGLFPKPIQVTPHL
ncbi:hypothetical protein CR513_29565, partial [Mucuna pruriens]